MNLAHVPNVSTANIPTVISDNNKNNLDKNFLLSLLSKIERLEQNDLKIKKLLLEASNLSPKKSTI